MDLFSTVSVLAAIVSGLVVICIAAPRTPDPLWPCLQSPLPCVPGSLNATATGQCTSDNQCAGGAQCCYVGCTRVCTTPDPCQKVICQEKYKCTIRETPCSTPPCQTEAYCGINKPQCSPPPCGPCQPGYKPVKDSNGCDTCSCEQQKVCSTPCPINCAYGHVLDSNGCATCLCKPAPESPCLNIGPCRVNQECRYVARTCATGPCDPTAMCVAKLTMTPSNEDRCGMADDTTTGLPVMSTDRQTELDCYSSPCPDGTVCTQLSPGTNRCCFQKTQVKVVGPPKPGQCPSDYLVLAADVQVDGGGVVKCERDGECLGDKKCCYVRLHESRSYGVCLSPVHTLVARAATLCEQYAYLKTIFTYFKLC